MRRQKSWFVSLAQLTCLALAIATLVTHVNSTGGKRGTNKETADSLTEDLIEWVAAHGGEMNPKIQFGLIPMTMSDGSVVNIRGGYARERMYPGEWVGFIPQELLFSEENSGLLWVKEREAEFGKSNSDILVLWLMLELRKAEAGEASFWAPYVKVVAAAVPDVPVFYTLERLRGSSYALKELYVEQTHRRIAQWTRLLPVVKRHFEDRGAFTFDEFLRAYTIIISRREASNLCTPALDMFNNSPIDLATLGKSVSGAGSEKRTHPDVGREGAWSTTIRRIDKGQQLSKEYAKACDELLLGTWGFANDPPSPCDTNPLSRYQYKTCGLFSASGRREDEATGSKRQRLSVFTLRIPVFTAQVAALQQIQGDPSVQPHAEKVTKILEELWAESTTEFCAGNNARL